MPKRKSSLFYSSRLARILQNWPGKRFGIFRYLPIFFSLGAGLEWFMINFKMGDANFYTVFKRRQAIDIIEKEVKLGTLTASSDSGT